MVTLIKGAHFDLPLGDDQGGNSYTPLNAARPACAAHLS
jgi:hypothetical protein